MKGAQFIMGKCLGIIISISIVNPICPCFSHFFAILSSHFFPKTFFPLRSLNLIKTSPMSFVMSSAGKFSVLVYVFEQRCSRHWSI